MVVPAPGGERLRPRGGRDHHVAEARRALFRRVHPRAPWVWKDPRTSVLLPFWRRALGPKLAAVVVVRNPLDVALSMQRRHSVTIAFAVALWERYNRLILLHSAGMPVLVTRYDDLVADPGAWTERTRAFLTGLGMHLAGAGDSAATAQDFVDPELRHSAHSRAALTDGAPQSLAVYDALEAVVGVECVVRRARSCPPSRTRSPPSSTRWDRAPSSPGTHRRAHPPRAPAPRASRGRALPWT